MADTVDPKHLDKRTAERYLRSGQLDEKAHKRYLESLPDVADKSVPVETFMLDDVEDDYDDEDETDDVDESDEADEADDEAPVTNNDEADLAAVASSSEDEPNNP
ncbi:RNA polymerase subunit sigma [Myxococcus faecalis]|uniref:RNA polymerase subunit sigma n=1 Tax=Myxococcus TaxID=32 RepID=UPI001143B431|nr:MULTISPECIES: RNA polymerase subunit sigma [Myxococcus]MCK8502696.1 RNA polymerase subunit sigma [Myxococcus fulvus]BDT36235.1 RNA polymerase subunit sigma [Myxococcus sp. MH1]